MGVNSFKGSGSGGPVGNEQRWSGFCWADDELVVRGLPGVLSFRHPIGCVVVKGLVDTRL